MANCALVKDGKVIIHRITPEGKPTEIYGHFAAECKRIIQRPRWADYGVVMKRRIDPSWVVFRNNERKRRIVLVNVEAAPADWLEVLCKLYGWS